MPLLATTGDECIRCQLSAGKSAVASPKIKRSVGAGGVNQREDVLALQKLLNSIEPANGGPIELLGEDGFVGPKTIAAIKRFQQQHHTGSDSRVDPDGPTLKKINEQPKKTRIEDAAVARMARSAKAMPALIAMARQGELTCDQAMIAIRGGSKATSRSFRLADLYFKFDQQADGQIVDKLTFIRTTFVRVKGVLTSPPSPITGGDPFGVNVFTNDPLGHGFKAYVPTDITNDPKRREHPDVHPGRVYLCVGIDTVVDDLFAHILMHEMFHFVDEETQARVIGDHGYGPKAMRLPHQLRMHNSDNFALFASHLQLGRARLVASQPKMTPFVPDDL